MIIVKETINLNEQKNKFALAAGLVIIKDHKILLVHPTNAKWQETYSIPKGHIEEGENLIEAAIRETKEEVGLKFSKKEIIDKKNRFIDYIDDKGNFYKRVYYFIIYTERDFSKKDFKLQKEEVDWAGFINKKEANKRIMHRFKKLLKFIK